MGDQPTIFRSLIELLLLDNRVEDAQKNFLALLDASPDTVTQVFGMIPTYLKRREDPAAYLAWSKQIVQSDLPSNVLESAYTYLVDATVQADRIDQLEALAKESLTRFGGSGAVRILARPLDDLIGKEAFAAVRNTLDALASTGDAPAMEFVKGTEITLAAAQEQWDSVDALFRERAMGLQDGVVRRILRAVSGYAGAAERTDVVDQLCVYVLSSMPEAKSTRSEAASLYVDTSKKAGDFDAVVARLQWMNDQGASDLVASRVSGIFYEVVSKASEASKDGVMGLAEALAKEADDRQREQLQALMMDGAVLREDYAKALEVLDAGFRAQDEEWSRMARNKLAAHLAIEEGRTDDAVRMFRDFMEHVKTWTGPQHDPSTGIRHSQKMSLGFNAQRIGNLYRDAGRADEAATAYAEARGNYATALEAAAQGSKEAAYINKQIAELPKAEPAPAM
jgi:tetratricopeptide (TPR) repeat protein